MTDNAGGSTQDPQQPEKRPIGLIVAGILGLFVVVFIFSNDHETPVRFLNVDAVMPMWAVILVSGLAGAVVSWLATTLRRRAKQYRRNS